MPPAPDVRPSVCHYVQRYLGLSETFIYGVLKAHSRFRPVVVAESLCNLDIYPIGAIHASASVKRYSWWWMVNGLQYRLLGQGSAFFEYQAYVRHVVRKAGALLIHAHYGPAGVRMQSIARGLGMPLVVTFYGYDMSRLSRQPRWEQAYQGLFAGADLFFVEGGHMRNKLVALGCPEDKVRVHRIGIELSRYGFRERRLAPGQRARVLFCGRLTEKKGLIYALKAVADVRTSGRAIEFRVIGDGDGRAEAENFVEEHQLRECVRFLGAEPHQVFLDQLDQAHILMQPSVTAADGDSEGGAPTVLLEAQACGVPVLSTTHADIPEVVRDGEAGFLVGERDSGALARRLGDLLEHPDWWPKMGRAGRLCVEKSHDVSLTTGAIEATYQELIDRVPGERDRPCARCAPARVSGRNSPRTAFGQ